MRLKKLLFLSILVFNGMSLYAKSGSPAVTYELTGGRFGDNLLSYIHAKWIAYKYDIPFLYKPFIHSHELILHAVERRFTNQTSYRKIMYLSGSDSFTMDSSKSVLYVCPYFPESLWERQCCKNGRGEKWSYFDINWNDKRFIAELRKVIKPLRAIPTLSLPADRISVAVHVRRGGNFDDFESAILGFPLKFLSDEFFINQIKELYILLEERPLYVYVFTDDLNPLSIVEKFKDNLPGLDIKFDCREGENSDTLNVIEDFFTMQKFDCLIHSESNYSFIMSKIGNYAVTMCPHAFHKDEEDKTVYDVTTTVNRRHKKLNKSGRFGEILSYLANMSTIF